MSKQTDILNKMFSEAFIAKDGATRERWKEVDTVFAGKQTRFEGGRGPNDSWKADVKTSHIFAYYQSATAVLMRDIPTIDLVGRTPDHDQLAKDVSKEITRIMRENEFAEREEELLYSGKKYGRALWKVTWDKNKERGVGGIRIDTVSAKSFVPQPGKNRMRDCAYVFEVQGVDKLSLLQMYPERKTEILGLFKRGPDDPSNHSDTMMAASYYDGTGMTAYYDTYSGGGNSTDTLPLIECWMYDDETVEQMGDILEPVDGDLKVVKRKRNFKKYPTGRMIRWCGDVVFEDRPNPFPCFPYVEFVSMSMEEPWPIGDLEMLIPLQKLYESRLNQLHDALNFAVRSGLIIGAAAGIKDPSTITNEPNQTLIVNDPTAVREMEGSRIPAEGFTSIDQILSIMDRVAGFPESIISGGAEGGRSGYAIEQLSELVNGRLKLQTYSIESTVRELAKQITLMIGAFYERGTHYPEVYDFSGVHPEMFEYYVRAGLNLPASRRAHEQYLLQLLDRAGPVGSPPHTAFFTYMIQQSDLPSKDTLINDLATANDQMAQMAAMAPPEQGAAPPNLQAVG